MAKWGQMLATGLADEFKEKELAHGLKTVLARS
jgi:hypothetical protein